MKFQTSGYLANLTKSLPQEMVELLGPPPLLSNEDAEIYYAVFASFVNDINPDDMLSWIWIKDLADYRLEILRYRRMKVELMQKAHDDYLQRTGQTSITAKHVTASGSESEAAFASSIHSWINQVEKIDRLLEVAEKRFFDTLRAIERHLGGFGETIRARGEKIIEGEVVTSSRVQPANSNRNEPQSEGRADVVAKKTRG